MDYGRLGPNDPGGSGRPNHSDTSHSSKNRRSKKKILLFSLLAAALVVCSAVSAAVILLHKPTGNRPSSAVHRQPTQAISRTCRRTRFPELCVRSLLDFPGTDAAGEKDLVHISVNMTLNHLTRALYSASDFTAVQMEPRVRSAFDACLELLEDSVESLSLSLISVAPGGESAGSTRDVLTWLSAAMTNQDTCTDGFADVAGTVKDSVAEKLKDSAELISICLAIFSAAGDGNFGGVPIQNRRRRLLRADKSDRNIGEVPKSLNRRERMFLKADISERNIGEFSDRLIESPVPEILSEEHAGEFPRWMNRRERRLMDMPVSEIEADIVVSKDGNGTVKTITEAIKKAPEHSKRRIIIYVRAGRYEEKIIKVGRKKTNLMFIGDGKGKTVISGGKSIFDNITTFHTASFATTGAGFIARDMTFENWAGPEKHQAVALRVGADHAVVYRCNIIGYQDTLYVHSKRQFFRECDIYGTVDFIFGNAAVVLQNCSIYARKPMALQKITITAQNRKDPNQNTGISIHACRILAAKDLVPFKGNFSTYLGRPWKLYSRVVYMLSYIGDHVDRRGWLEWNDTFALDTLYYGEYMNYGPGGGVGQRVKWPGYRVIKSLVEAKRFTVSEFIGSYWLPSTGVAFLAGLEL